MSSKIPSTGNITDKQESPTPTLADITKAKALNEEGDELMKAAKFDKALEKFTEAIELHQDPVYFCNRASIYCAYEYYSEAINDCRSAIEFDPKCADAYACLGLTFSFQNGFNEAIEYYKKALELDPENKRYKRDLAYIMKEFKDANQESSTPPPEEVTMKANSLLLEANEYMRLAKFNEAIQKYTEAIELNPNPIFLCNRAAAFCHLKKYDEAFNDCTDAVKLDGNYIKAYGRMGFISSVQGLFVNSVAYYSKALELDPNNKNYKEKLAEAKKNVREVNQ